MDVSSYHLELWEIAFICVIMVPVFFGLNYLVVKNMVLTRKAREDRVERFIAASVARDMDPKNRLKKRPRRKF